MTNGHQASALSPPPSHLQLPLEGETAACLFKSLSSHVLSGCAGDGDALATSMGAMGELRLGKRRGERKRGRGKLICIKGLHLGNLELALVGEGEAPHLHFKGGG